MAEPVPVHPVRVSEDGEIEFSRPVDFATWRRRFHGQDAEIVLRGRRRTRSERQNRFYWGPFLGVLAEAWGWEDREELHNSLKAHFLSEVREDRPIAVVPSSRHLTTTEWEEWLERVRVWAATEHGITLPLPNEVEWL